jgi:hypothetical protein
MIINNRTLKRKFVIIAVALSLCVSYSIASSVNSIPLNTSKDSILNNSTFGDWPDGSFKGRWGNDGNLDSGFVRGSLNLGRRSTHGRFNGEFNRTNDNAEGSFKGIFRANFILGKIKFNQENKSFFIFGLLRINKTHFQGRLFCIKFGIIHMKGEYEASFLPPLTGSYGVGVKSIHLVDVNRSEDFTPDDPDDYRELMAQIWYPISKEIDFPKVNYMDNITFEWLMGRSPVPLIMIPKNAYLFVCPHGSYEKPIFPGEDLFPVIIFSPGYDGVYQIYTSLIEDIVSHGFVVVSINHPYVSGFTVFPDGRTVGLAPDFPGDLAIRSVVDDAKFVLDHVAEMNNTDSMFKGRFDLSRVGMYGHSFGGASTAICCYEDSRFRAGLTLDGVFYMDNISEGLDTPFLMMLAEHRFDNDTSVDNMWELLENDTYKVGVIGSTHYGYTDVGILLRHFVPLIPAKILGFGTIDSKRLVNITKSFEIAFFEVYLKGKPVESLIGLASEFEEVKFQYK